MPPLPILFFLACGAALAQPAPAPRTPPPLPPGQEIYRAYCASCHGVDGKGNGPVAASLRMQPPDLTRLTAKYGEFPAFRLQRLLGGSDEIPVHGTRRMPVWGPGLDLPLGGERDPGAKAIRLIDWLRQLQSTPPPAR